MTELMHLVKFNYNDMIGAKKDPMVDSWLFMSSPVPILTILALYLYFVLSLGPSVMNSRKPFHLQKLLVAYNLYQPFRFGAVQYIFKHGCQPADQPQSPYSVAVSNGAWWYFFSKIIELLDTVRAFLC
uniref:Elongation of very long chain fatty acids protein n=1 Tax=Timema tahoe TaxID=61484 RepID=A0A7R9IUK6_9NEOP|nr:unnamed protein product [Timema tahoe]